MVDILIIALVKGCLVDLVTTIIVLVNVAPATIKLKPHRITGRGERDTVLDATLHYSHAIQRKFI